MIPRVLEPEVMDGSDEADEYDRMDHSAVNGAFAADYISFAGAAGGQVLDVGTGTAQIPIEMCRQGFAGTIVAADAAAEMLRLAERNVAAAGLSDRITVRMCDAKVLPFAAGVFAAVVSNSIVHHIPDPAVCLGEMARVCVVDGRVFVRDLLRPESDGELDRLVDLHAAGATPRQRQLFADSLRAALTVDEMQSLVAALGFERGTVRQTSDRHWTWAAVRG